MFLIKMSSLSAKKLKFVFDKLRLFINSALRFLILPLAIKFFNSPLLSKYISTSDIIFPSWILLLRKLLKVDGLIIVDLPYPENKVFASKCKKNDVNFIQLISPTTSKSKLKNAAFIVVE